jgi:pyrimidine-specific ribonucleoside hydrolase
MRTAWVLTCDPGVDDAIALAVFAGRRDCELRTVVAGAGNVPAAATWRNASGLVSLLGLDVAVGRGSSRALDGTPIVRHATSHGADGLAGLSGSLPAPPDDRPADGIPLIEGNVVATGPLTDVALALRAGQAIGQIVWMGGSLVPGAPEFNAGTDPIAVNAVLGAGGAHLTVVPLDVTRQVVFDRAHVARWAGGPPLAGFCARLARLRFGEPGRGLLHDPVALVAALEPGLFEWVEVRLRCVEHGDGTPGTFTSASTGSARPPNARLAVAVDVDAVRARILDAVLAAGSP